MKKKHRESRSYVQAEENYLYRPMMYLPVSLFSVNAEHNVGSRDADVLDHVYHPVHGLARRLNGTVTMNRTVAC